MSKLLILRGVAKNNFSVFRHGAQSISLSKFIPGIVKLLSDPTSSVRDTAFSTVVELYKHIGERLRMDLQRKNLIPAARLPALMQRFDEVKEAGELLFTAVANDRKLTSKFYYLKCDLFIF